MKKIALHATKIWLALAASWAIAAGLGGCSAAGYFGYLVAPEQARKTIEPEFAGLDNHRVAIVIFADQQVLYEYPYVKITLSSAIKAELTKQIKGVVVVDPMHVSRFQEEHINWDSMDLTAIGKALGAEYVLFVSLVEYTTREPGSVNLFHGKIAGQNSLYQTDRPEKEARVWRGDDISVVYPPNAPGGVPMDSDRAIRQATDELYAQALVKKFYKHKAPKENEQ